MVGVRMCVQCRRTKQKCKPSNPAGGDRAWINGATQDEKCARCVQYGRLCGPPLDIHEQRSMEDEQQRRNSAATTGSSRRRTTNNAASSARQDTSITLHRESTESSSNLVNDNDELWKRLNEIDIRIAASKELQEKMQKVTEFSLYDEAETEANNATMLASKHAIESEIFDKLRLMKSEADALEAEGDLPTAEMVYTRILEGYRETRVNAPYQVRMVLRQLAKVTWKRGQHQRAQNFAWDSLNMRESPPAAHISDLELLKDLARSLSETRNEVPQVVQSTIFGPAPPKFRSTWPPLQRMMESKYAETVAGNLFCTCALPERSDPAVLSTVTADIDTAMEFIREVSNSDLEARDPNDQTPLHMATSMGKEILGLAIMMRGKELQDFFPRLTNARDQSGQTVLAASIVPCSVPYIILLIENGAEVDPDAIFSAWTPLQVASMFGLSEKVKLLLEKGARVDNTFPNTKNAIELARDNGHHGIVQLLSGESPATP